MAKIPVHRSCAPRKGKGIPRINEENEEQTEETLYPVAVPPRPPILPSSKQPLIFLPLFGTFPLDGAVDFACRLWPLRLASWT